MSDAQKDATLKKLNEQNELDSFKSDSLSHIPDGMLTNREGHIATGQNIAIFKPDEELGPGKDGKLAVMTGQSDPNLDLTKEMKSLNIELSDMNEGKGIQRNNTRDLMD